jgi:hypothetical protein
MKIDLPIEGDGFNVVPVDFCGIDSYLITPEIGAKWNSKNLHFRSIIIDRSGNILSSGFKKFFNLGEKAGCYPNLEKFDDWKILNKLDGSLLITDFVNGTFSMRTRGTASYKAQKNFKDFEQLPKSFPGVVEFLKRDNRYSLLFEILTPNNVIVIQPQKLDFYFLGAINKESLQMANGQELLTIWREIGYPPVPEQYELNLTTDINSLSNLVKLWKGKEGVVVEYNNGQNRLKLKSDWYCFLHRIKSQLNSMQNLINFYIKNGMPSYENFYLKISQEFDFEIAEQLKPQLLKIANAGLLVKKEIESIKDFCISIRGFKDRKEKAECIILNYGADKKTAYVFSILDGKGLSESQLSKMLMAQLEMPSN